MTGQSQLSFSPPPDFRILFESAPSLYLVLDPDLKILAASDAYLDATMTRRENIIGRQVFEIFPDNPDDPNASGVQIMTASVDRVLANKVADALAVQKYDIRRPESEGGGFEERWWSPVNSPVIGPDGSVSYIIHRVEDVTAYVRLQQAGIQKDQLTKELSLRQERMETEIYQRAQEIQEANQHLRMANEELARRETEISSLYEKLCELDRLKSEFFANVSHELRTPLALILGQTEKLLSDAVLPNDLNNDLKVINRNARILLRHVNDLLDLSKLEAEKMGLAYTEADLASMVRLIASNFEPLAQERQVRFIVHAPRSIRAEVDVDKVQRVLMNVLSNAFKFTPLGGTIRCALDGPESSEAGGHDFAAITIADSGPGIPAEMREAVFERFRQLEGGSSRSFSGTGLGLAIARDFVSLMGGCISVGDAPEGGALFRIELPLSARPGYQVAGAPNEPRFDNSKAIHDAVEELRPPKVTGAGPVPHKDFHYSTDKALVLVIEDNPEMNDFVSERLSLDYQVARAFDGRDGLEKAIVLRPDLILTDMMMPEMSGDELVSAIRDRPELADVPVVLLTAKADDEMRVRLLRGGAQDYIMKPFSSEELRARVANLVEMQRTRVVLQRDLSSQKRNLTELAAEATMRRREAQAALEEVGVAREAAERASRARSRFLSMISHELRTPVGAIQLRLAHLSRGLKGPLSTRQRDLTAGMSATLNNLVRLVDSLLEYTRIESGRITTKMETFSLEELAREIIEDLRPYYEEKALEVRLEVEASVGKISSDVRLLRIVIANLLSNAIKFTERGHIDLSIALDSEGQRITVTDTGPGISTEQQERIFEPFELLEPLSHKHKAGIGLGLALVREIVGALGGRIVVQSQVGRGSAFSVILPNSQAQEAQTA